MGRKKTMCDFGVIGISIPISIRPIFGLDRNIDIDLDASDFGAIEISISISMRYRSWGSILLPQNIDYFNLAIDIRD